MSPRETRRKPPLAPNNYKKPKNFFNEKAGLDWGGGVVLYYRKDPLRDTLIHFCPISGRKK